MLDFEAPNASEVAWLNTGTYVARRILDAAAKTMTLPVYEVTSPESAATGNNMIRITKPAGVPPQP